MSSGKKILNVLGILASIFLSVVLVANLMVAPIAFSAMSLLNGNNISKLVKSVDYEEIIENQTEDTLESEMLVELLESDMFEELIDVYSKDVSSVLLGKNTDIKFNEDFVEDWMEDNIDELVELFEEAGTFEDKSSSEIRKEVEKNIDEVAEQIAKEIPTAKELKRQLSRENKEAKEIFGVLESLNALKATLIVTIIVLSGLIFVCRLFDFRGFKWLYIDLFIATAFSAIICAGLSVAKVLIGEAAESEAGVSSVVEQLFSTLTTGVIVRTVIMLVAAIGLVIAYKFVKKALAKKCAIDSEVVEETSEEIPVLEESKNTTEA